MEPLNIFATEMLQVLTALITLFFVTFFAWVATRKANKLGANISNFDAKLTDDSISTSTMLVALYKARENRECSVWKWVGEVLSYESFVKSIKKNGFKLKRVSKVSNDESNVYEIFKMTKMGHPTSYLYIFSGMYSRENWDVVPETEGSVGAFGVHIVTDMSKLGEEIQRKVENICQETVIKRNESKISPDEESYYFTIKMNSMTRTLYLQRHVCTGLKRYAEALGNNLMNNAVVTLQGKTYDKVSLSTLMSSIVKNYHNWKVNGLLFGQAGTGKTAMLKAMAWYLSQYNSKVKVVLADTSILLDSEPHAVQALFSILQGEYEEGKRMGEEIPTLLLLDEADLAIKAGEHGEKTKENSLILRLMDGMESELSGVRLMATVNLKQDEIRPEILRNNRCHLRIEFTSLSKENAQEVSKYVRQNLAKGFTFDEERFNEVLLKDNITLSDIYSCSLPTQINNLVKGIIEQFEESLVEAPATFDEIAETLQTWKEEVEAEEEEKENDEEEMPEKRSVIHLEDTMDLLPVEKYASLPALTAGGNRPHPAKRAKNKKNRR
jgi:hypothetical protein